MVALQDDAAGTSAWMLSKPESGFAEACLAQMLVMSRLSLSCQRPVSRCLQYVFI